MCNDANLDLVNINAYSKFGQNQFILSQDIVPKHNSDINQGLLLNYKCKMMLNNGPNLDLANINA